jgi:hypothetical protein
MPRRLTPEQKAQTARIVADIEKIRKVDPAAAKKLTDWVDDQFRRAIKQRARRGV